MKGEYSEDRLESTRRTGRHDDSCLFNLLVDNYSRLGHKYRLFSREFTDAPQFGFKGCIELDGIHVRENDECWRTLR